MHRQYICLNGEMHPSSEPVLMHNNRAFCYGDALFETMHCNGTRLQFFKGHYNRILRGMDVLGMEKESLPDAGKLESVLIRLLNKNHLYGGVRLRLSIFRNNGGYYSPADNSVSYIAETAPIPFGHYQINEKGLKTGLFTELVKQPGRFANLKSANSLLYVLAGKYGKEKGLDECIILNSEGRLAETVSSNIFILKNETLLTPGLFEGCVAGVMREQILRIAAEEGLEYRETQLTEEDLLSADECFLTNAVSGIRWVVAYSIKRYYSKTSKTLIRALNREQFGHPV